MWGDVFYWLLNMSITASVTGLIVLLIRRVKVVPRRVAAVLWAIPFLRMVIPWGINSPYGLMAWIAKVTTKTVAVYQPSEDITMSMTNVVMAADTYFPIAYKVSGVARVFSIAAIVWATGFLLFVVMLGVAYVGTLRELREAQHWRDNLYFSSVCRTPAVYGILKPKIVLPMAYENCDIELIVAHEKMHIRRADNLWRLLALLAAAVHWFNPLAWWFLKECLADRELACDECVLAKLGDERAKDYATVLLESGKGRTVFASAFGGATLRTRIENILTFKRMTWFSAAGCGVLVGIIFYVLLTNAG